MNTAIKNNIVEPRLFNIKELCSYCGLGENRAAEMGAAAGARRQYGKRVLYDRLAIDRYIDVQMQQE